MENNERNGLCRQHYGFDERIKNLAENDVEQWKAIGTKTPIWVVVLLVSVMCSVMGITSYFIFESQKYTRARLEAYQETLTGINPEGILTKIDKKLDAHLQAWPGPPHNNSRKEKP